MVILESIRGVGCGGVNGALEPCREGGVAGGRDFYEVAETKRILFFESVPV
jgi:hypothetical protein